MLVGMGMVLLHKINLIVVGARCVNSTYSLCISITVPLSSHLSHLSYLMSCHLIIPWGEIAPHNRHLQTVVCRLGRSLYMYDEYDHYHLFAIEKTRIEKE